MAPAWAGWPFALVRARSGKSVVVAVVAAIFQNDAISVGASLRLRRPKPSAVFLCRAATQRRGPHWHGAATDTARLGQAWPGLSRPRLADRSERGWPIEVRGWLIEVSGWMQGSPGPANKNEGVGAWPAWHGSRLPAWHGMGGTTARGLETVKVFQGFCIVV